MHTVSRVSEGMKSPVNHSTSTFCKTAFQAALCNIQGHGVEQDLTVSCFHSSEAYL